MLLPEKIHGGSVGQSAAGFYFDVDCLRTGVDHMCLNRQVPAFLAGMTARHGERNGGRIAGNRNIVDKRKETTLLHVGVLPELQLYELAGKTRCIYGVIAERSVARLTTAFAGGASI